LSRVADVVRTSGSVGESPAVRRSSCPTVMLV
jgi:hypothetical protein